MLSCNLNMNLLMDTQFSAHQRGEYVQNCYVWRVREQDVIVNE